MLFLSMTYLLVVKLISEGTCSDPIVGLLRGGAGDFCPYAPHLILKTIMTIKHWYSILIIIHDLIPMVKLFLEGTDS
jgi:hypothetical protein